VLPASADTLKIATYNVEMTRKGPGLLLRDIATGRDPQTESAAAVIAASAPDVLLLTGFDYDMGLAALQAFAARVAEKGQLYPHLFAFRPNTGWATGLDLDGDGRLGGAGDAQGFGRFAGEGGMAILSRLPIDAAAVQDFSGYLWQDLPGSLIDGAGLSDAAMALQRLSTTGHWSVPVTLSDGSVLQLLAWHGSPPVFDGPEDRNGRRNHDETIFWTRLLDGDMPWPAPNAPFVIIGDANLDPRDGDGRSDALANLLADPRVQDTLPKSLGGAKATQGSPNDAHKGDPALDTADWPEQDGPGNLRVDYVLPSADLQVISSGVWWPMPGALADQAAQASRHRLVWVKINLP
jgi:hypothetical protein